MVPSRQAVPGVSRDQDPLHRPPDTPRLVEVIGEIPVDETTAFYDRAGTVGAYTVFPAQVRVEGRWRLPINQARGVHPQIKDRFDLTLECMRRCYAGRASPLGNTLADYAGFFGLFGDFRGYVDHSLLNDLVGAGYASVSFYTKFDDSLATHSVSIPGES